tara:strand:+ start:1051 stop:1269 length:219 start_codon:yes stop_codon:yes gene_type:complete
MKNKHIWEGWTVQDFINELEPIFDMILTGRSCVQPFKTKREIKEWCAAEQPYYKKHIPDVVGYFVKKANLTN